MAGNKATILHLEVLGKKNAKKSYGFYQLVFVCS